MALQIRNHLDETALNVTLAKFIYRGAIEAHKFKH